MEETPLFTAEFIVRAEDYTEFVKFMNLKKGIAGLLLRIIIFIFIIYLLITGLIRGKMTLALVCAVSLFTYAFSMISQYRRIYRNNNKNLVGEKISYEFHSSGFTACLKSQKNVFGFQNICMIYETENYYYFMLSARHCVFMQKDSLSENDRRAFKSYITEKAGARFRAYTK